VMHEHVGIQRSECFFPLFDIPYFIVTTGHSIFNIRKQHQQCQMQRARPLVCLLLVTVSEQLQVLAFLVRPCHPQSSSLFRLFLIANYDRRD
jgi:hypothetical protein